MRHTILMWLALIGPSWADPVPHPHVAALDTAAPRHALFLGNSYLYYGDSIHYHVEMMANAVRSGPRAEFTSATISGARLGDHALNRHLALGAERLGHPFDAVVLQGHSTATFPEHRAAFRNTVLDLAAQIRDSGAHPVLYMTPAYAEDADAYRADMLEGLDTVYTEVGNAAEAVVIPVAHAFALAAERHPDLLLRKPWDGSHPSRLGTYLAAATVYESLFEASVVGNPYTYFGSFPADAVAQLQQVAADAVAEYHGRQVTQ